MTAHTKELTEDITIYGTSPPVVTKNYYGNWAINKGSLYQVMNQMGGKTRDSFMSLVYNSTDDQYVLVRFGE